MARTQWLIAATIAWVLPAAAQAQADATAALMQNLQSEDAPVRTKAFQDLVAMGDAGVQALLAALVEPGKGDDAGARFGLHGLAAHLGRPGGEAKPRAAYADLLGKHLAGDAPAATKRFVISQLEIIGGPESVAALAPCLMNEELAEHASRALAADPSAEALKTLREALPKVQGASRVAVIQALGERRDSAAAPLLLAEAKGGDADLRLAAMAALARIGDAKAEPVLAAALGRGADREQRAVLDAYLLLGEQLARSDRRAESLKVYATALKAATTEAGRCGALLGLGRAGSAREVPVAMAYLPDPSRAIRHVAERCLVGMPDPKTAEALAEALKHAEPGVKGGLLRVLAARKEPAAAQAIEAAAKDPSAEVRVTALQLLNRLTDPANESTLIEAATSGSPATQPVALEAYVRLADARRDQDRNAALAMYTRALDLAQTDPLRRMALGGLAAVAGEESLPKVEPYLANDRVRSEALRAYAGIAQRLADAGQRDRAVEMLQRVVALGPPRDVGEAAVGKLRALGVNLDPARAAGFVTTWWVLGPFPGASIDEKFPPEDALDLTATVKSGDRELQWAKHHTNDMEGIVDFTALLKPTENVTAYLYAEVTVDQAQDVVIKTGSDDAEKLWVNGQMVFRYPSPRSLTVDQDTIKTHLNAGPNKLLLKVNQGGGGWNACLRITSPEGKAVPFTQREQ